MSTASQNMVEGLKCYKILVFFVVIIIILCSSSILYPSYRRYQGKDLPIITRKANFTSSKHRAMTQMPSRQMSVSQPSSQTFYSTPSNQMSSVSQPSSQSFSTVATGKMQTLSSAERRRTKQPILLTLSTMKLPKLDESFRNPCWYDHFNGKTSLRCFPYFYLAGFPKCGTTDLYARLVAHPLIIAGRKKETHYLDRFFYGSQTKTMCSSDFHCGSVTFSRHYFRNAANMISMTNDTTLINTTFIQTAEKKRPSRPQVEFIEAFLQESVAIWKEGQKSSKYPGITVDASASTASEHSNFYHIAENQAYGFPRNTTADWIRRLYSGTKIIMILRDPVTRAFSDYGMRLTHHGMQPSAWDFHKRVTHCTRHIERCLASGKQPLLCTSHKFNGKLHTGLYYYHIKSWFEKFPREQILILKFEDYKASIPKTLIKVFKFLDLPAVSQEGLEFISKSEALNEASFKGKMLSETKALLTNFYKPFNEKLADLLGDDRFLWNTN